MKVKNHKKIGLKLLIPETSLEALAQLQDFFEADMWYAQESEWKKEEHMLKYLRGHFNICIKQIKRINKTKKG